MGGGGVVFFSFFFFFFFFWMQRGKRRRNEFEHAGAMSSVVMVAGDARLEADELDRGVHSVSLASEPRRHSVSNVWSEQ